MYLNILKKDMKRKKTMNIILLLFIILSATFVSSSVNNIIAVYSGIDYYFDKAGMADYFVATIDRGDSHKVTDSLDQIKEIDSYGIEPVIYMNSTNILKDGKKLPSMSNTSVLMNYEDAQITYFDKNNNPIAPVKSGTVWLSAKSLEKNNLKSGDKIEIVIDGVSLEYKIMGVCKDAFLGSEMMGMTRFIISSEDFEKYDSNIYGGSLCYIKTGDVSAVERRIGELDISTVFNGSREMIKLTYVMDMIIAGVLLVVSILLILTAFVVLRFTIAFTLSEEFREIGVMKAIGIRNTKIRLLYMTKYFALSVIGSAIGFFAGIPFGNLLLDSVSNSIVLESENSILINLVCAMAVITVILLFCFGCTRKVVKFTPLDAIRNGETGERFYKRSIIRLGKSKLKPYEFLALNEVLSNPKRLGIIAVTFILCLSPVLILANTVNTLKSDDLVTYFGVTKSDVYLSDEAKQMSLMSENGEEKLKKYLEEIEQTLANNGMPAKCCNQAVFKMTISHGDNICKSQVLKGIGTTTDMYKYYEGTPPQNNREVALTKYISEKLDAKIGDTITIRQLEGDKKYIVTALFQSMINQGEGVRLYQNGGCGFPSVVGPACNSGQFYG
ncbi:MAG: ABC transporter permease [Muricomes sp.]